jgi:hypothetical protein
MECETTDSPEALSSCSNKQGEEGDQDTAILLGGGQSRAADFAFGPICCQKISCEAADEFGTTYSIVLCAHRKNRRQGPDCESTCLAAAKGLAVSSRG